MGKLNKNRDGFSAVEVVLVVVIVALVGVVGWLVYKNHHKTTVSTVSTNSTNSTTSTNTATTPTQKANPYVGWKTAMLQYEKITYQYPSDWTVTDKSVAIPKNENACTYPGHDQVTLSSPTGTQVYFNAGQDCFGYNGDTSFGSVPITSLGQNLYLAFEASNGLDTPISPNSACLAKSTSPNTQFDFKSKNIFFNGSDPGSDPVNSFCYTPYNPSNYQTSAPSFTVAQIEATPDYNTAKLIFESMHY